MKFTRRHFCGSLLAASLVAGIGPAQAEGAITVKDMANRTVKLKARPRRIILLDAHDLLTMALLRPDPASIVVGWAATDRIDSDVLRRSLQGAHAIEIVGKMTPDTVSLEGLIALQPDLVVTTFFMTPPDSADVIVDKLQELDIPLIFSDASSNTLASEALSDPQAALENSMRMWGTLLGAEERAEAYLALVRNTYSAISKSLANVSPVSAYLEVQSTVDDCCWAAGTRIWGELLVRAGGVTLPGVTAPWFEKLSLEYLLSTPHDVYIASGGGWAAGGRPSLGAGIAPTEAQASLRKLVDARQAFGALSSVKNRRVHAIWTGLITNLPLNILFVAQVAHWLHPDRIPMDMAERLLETINREFASVPIEGPLWTSV